MFGLTQIKVWLVAAAGGAAALLFLLLRVYGIGKQHSYAEALKEGEKEEDALDSRIDAAHRAGNAARLQPVQNDPYDRANR